MNKENKLISALIGTVIGGVVLYYLPGMLSRLFRFIGGTTSKLADHLDTEFPNGTADFNKKEK